MLITQGMTKKRRMTMAKKKKENKSIKRFGTRYGRTLKDKVGKIETLQRQKYRCPNCHYKNVKQVSAGIWHCEKCGAKFTSKAYTIAKLPVLKEEKIEG